MQRTADFCITETPPEEVDTVFNFICGKARKRLTFVEWFGIMKKERMMLKKNILGDFLWQRILFTTFMTNRNFLS